MAAETRQLAVKWCWLANNLQPAGSSQGRRQGPTRRRGGEVQRTFALWSQLEASSVNTRGSVNSPLISACVWLNCESPNCATARHACSLRVVRPGITTEGAAEVAFTSTAPPPTTLSRPRHAGQSFESPNWGNRRVALSDAQVLRGCAGGGGGCGGVLWSRTCAADVELPRPDRGRAAAVAVQTFLDPLAMLPCFIAVTLRD